MIVTKTIEPSIYKAFIHHANVTEMILFVRLEIMQQQTIRPTERVLHWSLMFKWVSLSFIVTQLTQRPRGLVMVTQTGQCVFIKTSEKKKRGPSRMELREGGERESGTAPGGGAERQACAELADPELVLAAGCCAPGHCLRASDGRGAD